MSVPYLLTSETELLKQVKYDLEQDEGFREYAYPDPLSKLARLYKGPEWPWGVVPARELLGRIPNASESEGSPWTYGFGFTNGVTPDSRILRIQAERKLEELILQMNLVLSNALSWYKTASLVTKTILINMAFNMGLRTLLTFRNTLSYINQKNYTQAAQNMKLSLWYTQTGVRAKKLVNRMATQTIEPQSKQ